MKYGWFDFATAKPSLDDLLKDIRGSGGAAAPAVKQGPTKSEIISAQAKAVGGGRKRCVKGKSCSATCIDSQEYCLVDFPVPVSGSLTDVRDFIENRLKNRVAASAMTQEQADKYVVRLEEKDNFSAARAKELYKGLQKLQEEHTKDGKFDKEGHRKALDHVLDTIVLGSFTPRDKKAPLTVEEIEGLHANRETWTKLAKLQREVAERSKKGEDISPQELQTKLRPIVEP